MTPDEPEREKVEAIIKKMRAAPSQIPWPYDLLKEAADLLHAAEKRAEEAERERERWLIAAIGSLAKIGVPTPANARQDFGPEMLSSEIAMLGFKRDSAREVLGKVVEALDADLLGVAAEALFDAGKKNLCTQLLHQAELIRSALKDAGK
jgi:hypothetical protein